MPKQSCNWLGSGKHYCDPHKTAFLCRYKDETTYCVGGKRIIVSDNGRIHAFDLVTENEVQMLRTFLLEEYRDYLFWRSQKEWPKPLEHIQPFDGKGLFA